MANEKTPVVWDDTTKKHRPLGTGEKMGGLDASSIISSDSGNLIQTGSDGLALVTGSSLADPRADNLLEESDRGKLQVTVDRIAEWLDGHPQDAAVLAEAINVVSGDSGNVITAGSDKGAFLSKGAIAASVAGMTDAQKAQLADAIAARIASDIADGKTIVASGGKLTADPTNATAAQKKAINQALADADSGLVVNNSTGKLQVDFSQMPTDKFEALLKGLKMLVPLDSNKTLYVSTNNSAAGDTIIDGRGTAAKPFKTIGACARYAAETYSLGRYSIYINVVAGTYNENITLPDFSRGTGSIWIRSDSGARDVTVVAQTNSYGTRGSCFYCSGGKWQLQHIATTRVEHPTTAKSQAPGCFVVSGSGSELHIRGCAVQQSFPASPSPLGGETYDIRPFYADGGGKLYIEHDVLATTVSTEKSAGSPHGVNVFAILRGSELWFPNGYDEDNNPQTTGVVQCSGSCTRFLWISGDSKTFSISGGNPISFTGTVTGKRYAVDDGSKVMLGHGADWFPGDVAGTVDDATYSVYA